MQRRQLTALALSVVLSFSTRSYGQNAASEVHLVSIYEGFKQVGDKNHGSQALVRVDRPGKRVTLVLTSYERTTWHVTASKNTQISKVILGGAKPQSVEGATKLTKIIKAWRGQSETPLGYSYKPIGPRFRLLLKQIHNLTKSRLASHQGAYQARPDAPFLIEKIENNPLFSIDYPQPTPPDKLPKGMSDVTFHAHQFTVPTISFGRFNVLGPIAENLKPLPKGVDRVVYDPSGKQYYGITSNRVVQIDREWKKIKPMELGPLVPRLSRPFEITYDSKRKRIVAGSFGRSGFLYAYSPETGRWSVISPRPKGLIAFAHSTEDDYFYGVVSLHSEVGNVASLVRIESDGSIVSRTVLGPPIYPGCLADAPKTQVAILGKYVVILTSPGGSFDRSGLDAASIYLVDPIKNQVWLTSKKRVGK